MSFTSVRIITKDIQPLVQFYEKVLESQVIQYTEDFAELRTPLATLALASNRTLGLFGKTDIARPAENHSVILEFRMDNVDTTYKVLAGFLGNKVVQEPTTMPWGNRSLLFRDPDGNLVNFFTPLTEEAKQRFGV
ncbi:VOC family protein [Mucilaginibacter sp. SP1R1]|uniref:VOC family protein n=1 Tax=Mucilaginibacter sp. SP1R1 TaxID=2723091 RepID=UPI00161DC799|nr:VOC family protein [Mucilaginibacter sp. SP1R1]MBB6148403.1 putative enzyme related to lactoylglutathione lyase [Mucilaginibacter sp. SP1R1]